jgi:hypothetical protein
MLTWAMEGRKYTVKDLIKAAGVSKSKLYRDNRFEVARKKAKALGSKLPKGHTDADGELEAYAPEDEG